MIIVGYPGIGKSTLAYENNNFVDLDSTAFYHKGGRIDNWYVYYCRIAYELSKQGFNVFISSHECVVNYIKKHFNDEKILCVFPSIDAKDAWIYRMRKRLEMHKSESNARALNFVLNNFDSSINFLMNCGLEYVTVDELSNLEDIIEKYK